MSSELDRLIASYHSPECEFNVDRSIELCKEILKINPNLVEFQENLACGYYNKMEYEKSIELFNKSIENGGENDDSYLMIALSYVKLEKYEKALETIKKTKDKENYLFNHLRLYEELKDYDKAIEYGDMLLELDPENRFALIIMSNIYDEIHDGERSLFYFRELSNLYPEAKSILLMRLYSNEKYDELIETFEELKENGSFEKDLESPQLNSIIGMSYFKLNRHYDSLKYLINSDRLYPTVDKKIAIAKNYIEIFKFNLAYRYLKEALEMDELNETCLFLISESSYYLGNHMEAIEYANRLLNNHQNNRIFYVLAAIYFDLKDNRNAFESLIVGTRLILDELDEYEDYDEYIIDIAVRLSKAGYEERAENIFNTLLSRYPEHYRAKLELENHFERIKRESENNNLKN